MLPSQPLAAWLDASAIAPPKYVGPLLQWRQKNTTLLGSNMAKHVAHVMVFPLLLSAIRSVLDRLSPNQIKALRLVGTCPLLEEAE